ncbi:MAG: hypothetical protein KKB25_02970, partial [Nanoarchaeota archaeon]|nr:hypothetical protein [Nanoarchaeota archaeon]
MNYPTPKGCGLPDSLTATSNKVLHSLQRLKGLFQSQLFLFWILHPKELFCAKLRQRTLPMGSTFSLPKNPYEY